MKALKKPKKWTKSVSSKLSKNKILKKLHNKPILFAGAFAAVAVLALVIVRAAPFTASSEAENANLTGNAMTLSGAGTSNGSYIRFGSQSSSGGCADGPLVSLNICLNTASIESAVVGESQNRTSAYPYAPFHSDGVAAFRTECAYSHTNKDDPIVYPGQQSAAHWHQFVGNTAANYTMTDTRAQGNSTCMGGAHNKTAYWAPALIDTNSYNSTTKEFNTVPMMKPGDPNIEGGPQGGAAMQVYYKSGYWGVLARDVQPFPAGLKMIAGANATVEPTGPHAGVTPFGYRYVHFDCITWGHAQSAYNGIYDRTEIPADCPPNAYIQARIVFPQCGARNPDGSPVLDSANHRSHMSYPNGWPDLGCPSTHPIAYPEIIEHFRWKVPSTGSSGLRFSSDMYPSRAAGWTFHADWWNGWDPTMLQQIIDNCFHANVSGQIVGLDCGTGAMFAPGAGGGNWYGFDAPRNVNGRL